ncbi:MAG TPA: hypothetical protein VMJ11_03915 [Paraburkholderia sp.]|uniref:hypothetical protein n=1 Tax=Paraburkholderia sp. TaxID=1926495 RepID=UPI002C03DEB0|nr:hypothetical protein [Paraburkholderia sp.]HTR05801.1 hypothetical protein [Paraburkholderia sp.]
MLAARIDRERFRSLLLDAGPGTLLRTLVSALQRVVAPLLARRDVALYRACVFVVSVERERGIVRGLCIRQVVFREARARGTQTIRHILELWRWARLWRGGLQLRVGSRRHRVRLLLGRVERDRTA